MRYKYNLLTLIILVAVAVFLTNCNETASNNDWVGEYTIKVQSETYYTDGTISEEERILEFPCTIYKDGIHLYVQSCFGQPYMGEGETTPPTLRIPKFLPQQVDSLEGETISDNTPHIVMANGLISTLLNGKRLSFTSASVIH